ncbi:MAG: hypothetical protein ABJF50_23915 [Paracoccaceae bacterium]
MLFTANKDSLGEKPHLFRYIYFLLSSFRVISYGQWKSEGEPNPFVSPQEAKRRHTSQQEIADIFQDKI